MSLKVLLMKTRTLRQLWVTGAVSDTRNGLLFSRPLGIPERPDVLEGGLARAFGGGHPTGPAGARATADRRSTHPTCLTGSPAAVCFLRVSAALLAGPQRGPERSTRATPGQRKAPPAYCPCP